MFWLIFDYTWPDHDDEKPDFCGIAIPPIVLLYANIASPSNSAVVLDKVVEYFHYWYKYRNSEDVPDMDIPVELCLELLAAADFLGLDQ